MEGDLNARNPTYLTLNGAVESIDTPSSSKSEKLENYTNPTADRDMIRFCNFFTVDE